MLFTLISKRTGLRQLLLLTLLSLLFVGCPPPPENTSGNACLQCHDSYKAPDARGYLLGAHARFSCERCHGDGTEHMQAGGRFGVAINVPHGEDQLALCSRCHPSTVENYLPSKHATRGIECSTCHDAHTEEATSASFEDNTLCLQCHEAFGFSTVEELEAHTAHFPYNPLETGAGRCTGCHMAPLAREEEVFIPHVHDMLIIQPQQTVDQLAAGEVAMPNSCLGAAGCHDGSTIAEPNLDLDDILHNELLQEVYETVWGDL